MNSKYQLIKGLFRTREKFELGVLAMGWLDRHWDELPEGDFPVDWLLELTDVMEVQMEEGARQWLATK